MADWRLGMPIDTPCGHATPQAPDQLHGVCIACWRNRAGTLSANVDAWGPGDKVDAKAYDTVDVGGGRKLELFFGQHPHSRRDNNTYARDESGDVTGWDGHRAPVEISVREHSYLKSSGLGGSEWRKACRTDVTISGVHVYTLGAGRDWLYALTRLPDVVTRLLEHPIQFWGDRERLVGRRVWYRDQAAVVEGWTPDHGVLLIPDGTWSFRQPGWARGEDGIGWDEDEDGRGVNVDVLSSDISWFRDDGVR